jgi:hypothetical protein
MRGSLVAVAGALAALAIWQAAPGPDDRADPVAAAPLRADPEPEPAAPPVAKASAASAGAATVPEHVTRTIDAAIDRHIEAVGRGGQLGDSDRAALRDALLEVRRASTRARRRSRDYSWQAEQTRVLVAADRVFRERLGVGLSEFMADAGPPGRVEDLGRRPPS